MVYASLDNYSAILKSVSVRFVLEKLCIYSSLYEDFLDHAWNSLLGWNSTFTFNSNGIRIEIKWNDFISHDGELDKIVEVPFSWMRLELGGSGLRYLRSEASNPADIDKNLADPDFWEGKLFRITRCDFAYDFVNIFPDFIDKFSRELWDLQYDINAPRTRTGNSRELGYLNGKRGESCKYYVQMGSGVKYIRLGSNDYLTRMYDKKLELCDKTGAWKKSLSGYFPSFPKDQIIETWFRIEIQVRNAKAQNYLFNLNGDMLCVLRDYFDHHQMKDPRTNQVFPAIQELFNWEDLPLYLCILHFTELKRPIIEKSENTVSKYLNQVLIVYAHSGVNGLLSMLENRLNEYNNPTTPMLVMAGQRFSLMYHTYIEENPTKRTPNIRKVDGKWVMPDWRSV